MQLAGGLTHFCRRILNILSLVQNDQMKIHASQRFHIALEQRVGREHYVCVRHVPEVFLSPRALQNQHAQGGDKLSCLLPPVWHHRCRSYHQGRPAFTPPRDSFGKDMRKSLQGLTEPHVIRKDSIQLTPGKALHPLEAFELVVSKRSLDPLRGVFCGRLPELLDLLYQPVQPLARVEGELGA